ncbi:hypothetical protein ERJ75_000499100 [Trypanosoma vivax]|nr:hypothetical protein ERJ75_000499100 [Trypanosoma vivax]
MSKNEEGGRGRGCHERGGDGRHPHGRKGHTSQGRGCGPAVLDAGADEHVQDSSGVQEQAEAECADSLGSKVLGDTALARWTENVSKLSAADSASWNLAKSICAPRPMTSPVLVVGGHPLTKRRKAQALSNMYMARSTKAPHAPEMNIPSARHSTFQHITEAELDVALRELSSGTAPGDDENHCEELKRLGVVSRRCILRLFNCSLRT